MIQVTRSQVDYLIDKNYMESKKGRYEDLTVLNRQKKSKHKKYYVSEKYVKYLELPECPKY